uniref:basic salivary proline-rich protein 2-like n=1 Tax=Euleptes europaea TaxID=460621 RepID=UPI002541B815|nr:basic salivary proline-rich protein 2-like [Euleptes europaea]
MTRNWRLRSPPSPQGLLHPPMPPRLHKPPRPAWRAGRKDGEAGRGGGTPQVGLELCPPAPGPCLRPTPVPLGTSLPEPVGAVAGAAPLGLAVRLRPPPSGPATRSKRARGREGARGGSPPASPAPTDPPLPGQDWRRASFAPGGGGTKCPGPGRPPPSGRPAGRKRRPGRSAGDPPPSATPDAPRPASAAGRAVGGARALSVGQRRNGAPGTRRATRLRAAGWLGVSGRTRPAQRSPPPAPPAGLAPARLPLEVRSSPGRLPWRRLQQRGLWPPADSSKALGGGEESESISQHG